MSHALPRQYHAATHRAVANADAIEWEELPSLQQRVTQRAAIPPHGANDSRFMGANGAAWDNTMPAALDPMPAAQPQPFHEALPGLSAREVFEEGVFQHFFTGAGG